MQATTSNSKLNQTSIQNWLVEQISEELSLDADTINVNEPLTRYGLDSIDAVTLVGDLEDWLELELPDTLFWDHPSIAQASQFLIDNYDIPADLESVNSSSETQVREEKLEPVAAGNGKKGNGGFFKLFS
jgi:acyl carrier protein